MRSGFWRDRRVFLTGHTGFKGSWLLLLLEYFGARTHGYALAPETDPSLFELAARHAAAESLIGDVRDAGRLAHAIAAANPQIAIHMAAQALVRQSYRDPVATFSTNIIGTVNFLRALEAAPNCKVALVITSDKVYANDGSRTSFAEQDRLGGNDPYSASKACAEIATASYRSSFPSSIRLVTVRAGNVIGGGDWAADRLVPDVVRALSQGVPVALRYPEATRPWQHVLDVLRGYLLFAERLAQDSSDLPNALNFGPSVAASPRVRELAEAIGQSLGATGPTWRQDPGPHPPEATMLRLDCRLAEATLGWRPLLDGSAMTAWTADWYRRWRSGDDMRAVSRDQIGRFLELASVR